MDLHAIREDYCKQALAKSQCAPSPLAQFQQWLNDALHAQVNEPTAMNVATVAQGKPSSRMVLLKEVTPDGLIFFSNYQSRKGQEIADNPYVAVTFFWAELERQVRFEGTIEPIAAEQSDHYFYTRPYSSRIGAWASEQSQVIPRKSHLLARAAQFSLKYPVHVPRPPHWGGYLIRPTRVEFWQGRPSRLHDRLCYQQHPTGWHIVRLAP